MLTILVTGDRNWWDDITIYKVLRAYEDRPAGEVTVIHGAARGADLMADKKAREFGYAVEAYPADWERFKKAAGPIRNTEMLKRLIQARDAGDETLVLAFHPNLSKSKGTANMVMQAREEGFEVKVFRGLV